MVSPWVTVGMCRPGWGLPTTGPWMVVLLLLPLGSAPGCRRLDPDLPPPVGDSSRIEGAPLCPWRHPVADCATWFPGADRTEAELQILSALRSGMAERLGRPPSVEDNARHVHHVFSGAQCLGEVVVQRVRGDSGALEVVVGLDPDGRVVGVRIQRCREPAPIVSAIEGDWLASFRGRRTGDPLRIGIDLPSVPPEAIPTADAIQSAVRAVLILRDLSSDPRVLRRPDPESSVGRL